MIGPVVAGGLGGLAYALLLAFLHFYFDPYRVKLMVPAQTIESGTPQLFSFQVFSKANRPIPAPAGSTVVFSTSDPTVELIQTAPDGQTAQGTAETPGTATVTVTVTPPGGAPLTDTSGPITVTPAAPFRVELVSDLATASPSPSLTPAPASSAVPKAPSA